MVNSMTGFGRGSAEADGRELTVELKSVNHRYLDIGMRLPRPLSCLEDVVRSVLQSRFARGHVDVYIYYRNTRTDSKVVEVDGALLNAYLDAAKRIGSMASLTDDLTLCAAMRFPDVIAVTEAEDDREALALLCTKATKAAADELFKMRAKEGEKLAKDLFERAQTVLTIVEKVSLREPQVVTEYRDKLHARIEELLAGKVEVDEARLASEVAYFADKASISEELVRLKSHISQLQSALSTAEPSGRKLDFIVQEMNREMNTIGSKAADLDILNTVIDGKGEIEKIREQVQNIE